MAIIRVTSEELHQQGQRVSQGSASVQDTIAQLRSQIGDLSTRWEGSASQSFQAMYDEWQRGAQQVQQAMDGISQFLQQAAATYEQAEEQIRQSSGH